MISVILIPGSIIFLPPRREKHLVCYWNRTQAFFTFTHCMAALVRIVDRVRTRNWEGGLAGGLLQWNRPPSLSWYQGRGGEQKNPRPSYTALSITQLLLSLTREVV